MPLTYLSLLTLPLLIWAIVLTIINLKIRDHYNRFTAGTEKKDLLEVLNQLLKQSLKNQKDIEAVNKRLDHEVEVGKSNFKKFGFKRFNPFTNTGGDQSFVLTLLDEFDNGFVISSLHSRENTRIYAKKIVGGQSTDQVLSDEEKSVITSAKK